MRKTFLPRPARPRRPAGSSFVATDDIQSEELRRSGEALAAHGGGEVPPLPPADDADRRARMLPVTAASVVRRMNSRYERDRRPPSLAHVAGGPGPALGGRRALPKMLFCGPAGRRRKSCCLRATRRFASGELELLAAEDHRTAAVCWGCVATQVWRAELHSMPVGVAHRPTRRGSIVRQLRCPPRQRRFDSVSRTVLRPAMALFRPVATSISWR